MEAGNNRIRLCQALSIRPPRFTNECRDVHSPIGSCDDTCDIRFLAMEERASTQRMTSRILTAWIYQNREATSTSY